MADGRPSVTLLVNGGKIALDDADRAQGRRITCPVLVPRHHRGALSIVDDRPVFVDTSSDRVHAVEPDGLGEGRRWTAGARRS